MDKLSINELSIKINNQLILDKINVVVKPGELVSIFGKSGAGKSMLLQAISGFVKVSSGTISIDGNNVSDVDFSQRGCILLDQDILLFEHMSVFDNIAFGLKMQKLDKKIIKEKVVQLSEELGIKEHLNKFPGQLSGGEQQRTALARALAINPQLLLLDEPFSKLDANVKTSIYRLIKRLQAKYSLTIILVTHDKNEALLLSDKIAVLANKQIVDYDTPQVIYNYPNSIETVRLFNNANIIDKNIFNNDKLLVIPYDKIVLSKEQGYQAQVIDREYLGDKYLYTINYSNNMIKVYSNNVYQINQDINFRFNEDDVRYY